MLSSYPRIVVKKTALHTGKYLGQGTDIPPRHRPGEDTKLDRGFAGPGYKWFRLLLSMRGLQETHNLPPGFHNLPHDAGLECPGQKCRTLHRLHSHATISEQRDFRHPADTTRSGNVQHIQDTA
jgi:hypothetical protein